ncbi:MAG: AI-2E family transporter [Ruminococcaceae bacterium]|nr:AI-2E family transporter [Oscillospiraceae bacterium]
MITFYKKRQFIVDFIYICIWSMIIFVGLKFLFVYLTPFLFGVAISYFVQRPSLLISKKIKINKRYCASTISVFIFLILIIVLIILFRFLYFQCENLIDLFSNNFSVDKFLKHLNKLFDKSNSNMDNTLGNIFIKVIEKILLKISDFISSNLSLLIKKVPNFFISATITIVLTFYISKDYDKLKSFVIGFFSDKSLYKISKIKNIFIECFIKISIGYLLIYAITFIELLIGFTILGVDNKFLLAFIISLVDILPILGTGTVLAPWAVFEILNKNYKLGIGICILYVITIIIRNFIEPKIIGKQADINPIFTLLFILIGLRLGGIIGMIIIPIVLTVAFTYLRQEVNNKKEGPIV